ncbi:MAG: LPS export ABC transporter periplasmic protein LptC [Acidobacteria bacterium]|nr:LPS export ABC transporter periplasmic protein LptC [Acidobacteriota bacterium]MDA1234289.1 LPS export ABC transporter periplasmic protein LptC [Acidobacteriota bacterium]
MRTLRILALLAAIAVAIVAWRDYQTGQERLAIEAAAAPAAIASDVSSQSAGWSWSQTAGNRQRVAITAGGFREDRERSGIQLTDVRLEIQHPETGVYDRVVTEEANFDAAQNRFHSEGRVVVTLGLPTEAGPDGESRYTRITTTGATFNTETGEVWTEREVSYEFDGGRGRSLGARYDSLNRRFTMYHEAVVERFASSPTGDRTVIRAGQLEYFELQEQVKLTGGCSLERGSYRVTAESADVFLEDGALRQITAGKAFGSSRQNGREVRFETPLLRASYSLEGWIQTVVGEGASKLTSTTDVSLVSAEGDWIELRYAAEEGEDESSLTDANLVGNATVSEQRRGRDDGLGRRVESRSLHLKMRPGGDEVAYLETLDRGRITISPETSSSSARRLDGDRLRVDYGADSRMEKLTAGGRVELRDVPQGPGRFPLTSWSETLDARFDQASGELLSLEQGGGTRFEQDQRKGSALESVYQPALARLLLAGDARVDQPSVAIAADKITLTSTTGQLDAAGRVTARYSEDAPSADRDGMFEEGEPVFAAADTMSSNQGQGRIVYEGRARLWQKVNRVEASRIVVDRSAKTLAAAGEVRSTLRGPEEGAQPALVRSASLLYREQEREAQYRGAVQLSRGPLRVKGDELDAYLAGETGASLRSAEARGSVEVLQTESGRKGFGDKARYDATSQEVILDGTPARAMNARGEETRGARLIYKIDDDGLRVEGGKEPAFTVQRQAND